MVVLSAVKTSLEKSVVPPANNDPTVVLTGVFHISGIILYGCMGGSESRWTSRKGFVSAIFTCGGWLKGLLSIWQLTGARLLLLLLLLLLFQLLLLLLFQLLLLLLLLLFQLLLLRLLLRLLFGLLLLLLRLLLRLLFQLLLLLSKRLFLLCTDCPLKIG